MPMWKLDNELIKKINSYPAEESDREIARKLWISRKSVAKYREDILETLSKEDRLSKWDKKKLQLLEHYSDKDIQEMLKVAGVESLDKLYAEVPDALKLKRDYNIPEAKSEQEVRAEFERLGKMNTPLICFAGGGVYDHYTPSVINYITQRWRNPNKCINVLIYNKL